MNEEPLLPQRRYREGFDLHRVVFTSCLGIAVYLGIHAAVVKGPFVTIFDKDAPAITRQFVRGYFPWLAERFGL